MKTKIFILLLCSIVFASCSQDETNTEVLDEANLVTNKSTLRSSDSLIDCVTTDLSRCGNFDPDVINFQETYINVYTITYKDYLSLDEIDCMRMSYFTCFPNLRMGFLQPSNPYVDIWKTVIGYPGGGGSVANTAEKDDRLSGFSDTTGG